jgi:cytochrome c oxidase assembly protein subunit 15
MIFAKVVIGGVTRLTESGLSITEWKPAAGAIPPLSDAAWQEEFAKYQQIPQYRERNAGMTLAEFKTIFWWEFVHRLWGRLIGFVYAIPLLWFVVRGHVRGALAWRLAGIFVLGGLQGALGWYMVKSGLVDRVSVSQYRLTAHLGLALLIYAATLWTALDLLRPSGAATRFSRGALAFAALVFLTILAGGFVAGLDAGMSYNTFPLMDGHLVPRGYLDETPWWANLFENVAAVQFNHRVLAMTTLVCALGLAFAGRASRAYGLALATGGMALLQVALGISTLLLVVPIPLAAAHQAGAVALLTLALATAHAARVRP